MKTLIPLYCATTHPAWQELLKLAEDPHAARQMTVIINPAGGPGPDKSWNERPQWLALMAQLKSRGARLALYIGAQEMAPPGTAEKDISRRSSPRDLSYDLLIWRMRWLHQLGEEDGTFFVDMHPLSMESLAWPEIAAFYSNLRSGDRVIANCRTVPGKDFARACPAHELVIHDANGWPVLSEPSLAGKPTHILACNTPGLTPGAKRTASSLYAIPAPRTPGTWHGGLSPLLPRILSLNVA